ncbi:MAG: CBS domain-containing protein [Candidatus Micrarchaeaceae archaeon]
MSAKVKDLMSRSIVAVNRSTQIEVALKLLRNARVGLAVVIEGGKVIGTVAKEDLEKKKKGRVDEVMNPPIVVEESEDVEAAAKKMVKNNITRVAVVNSYREMMCVGIITSTEVAKEIKKRS